MAPKKKGAAAKKGKQLDEPDIEIDFGDDSSQPTLSLPTPSAPTDEFNVDEEGNDLGGLMAILNKSRSKGGAQKKSKKARRGDDDEEEDAAEILARMEAQESVDVSPAAAVSDNKKNKKGGKKSKQDDDESIDTTASSIPISSSTASKPGKPQKNAKKGRRDDDVEDAAAFVNDENEAPASVEAVVKATPAAAAKGKKGGKKGKKDDFNDGIELLAAQIEGKVEPAPIATSSKPSTAAATTKPTTATAPAADDSDDENDKEAGTGGEVRIKSKKEKEREKKERAKLAKKQEASVKAASAPIDKPSSDKPPAADKASDKVEAAADNEDAESEDEGAGGASAASKKKKKPKKKPAAAAEEVKPAPKKKGAAIGALKELLAAKQAAEEEARRLEEEERKRIEEEEALIAAEEAAKEEAKRLKKEREKAKKEELKKSGQYMTPAEREKKRQQELKLQQMIASGLKVAALEEDKPEGETVVKKRVVYANKKKTPKQPKSGADDSASASVDLSASITSVDVEHEPETPTESPEDIRKRQEEEAAKIKLEEAAARARAAVLANDEWASGGHVKPLANSAAKDSWDAETDEEDLKDSWDAEDEEPAVVPSSESVDVKEEVNPVIKDVGKKTPESVKEAAPVAATASTKPPVKKPVPKEEEEESSEEDEEDDDDDGSDEDGSDEDDDDGEETVAQKVERVRREQAAERRKQRHEEAMAARSKDDLRSPICCILGHVDTGKTKLLDKVRQTNVQEGEAGGITQQIGATYFPLDAIETKTASMRAKDALSGYKIPGLLIIDTPGHESFANLRSRGSSLCNIAILVVDLVHGLEPQTIESINLLKQRKTPFIVALNKIDRMFDWKPLPNAPVRQSLAQQPPHTVKEFEERVKQTQLAFAEQGFNSCLYYDNPDTRRNVSLVPTSAITGEGIPDLLNLIVEQTQTRLSGSLMYLSEVECTVLEVKVIEGFGTTIDVVLSNGILNEGDKVVLCGLNGPIVTNIRALLTPQPLRELRIKGQYVHHKQVKAALGVKIAAPELEKAIAGSRLLVVGPDDDEEEMKADVMEDLTDLYDYIDKSGKGGVCVQASTLGSLEALLVFLKQSSIPVSGINIGPVFKKDIIRAGVMLERRREFAQLLAFDVPIDKDAQELADEMGVKIFRADIIYHLFDQFMAYMKEIQEQKKRDDAPAAVFPCHLKMVQGAVFNKRMPIIIGMDVKDGSLRIGTPIVSVDEKGTITKLGKVTGIELDHKKREMVKRGEPSVAVKIDCASYETPKMFGRHFTEKDEFYSEVTRQSIDILKTTFKNDVSQDEWKLIIKLKKILKID
ncbi:hypothetical protein SmJEL517_g00977 [Synchytrium microbalum]|uniref:Eukaryotic translation initiation factor 5B n=1 Tax=Synchytrium microbalum TaxID=1806994 RepID=A0A507CG71_9FUNG|nr:uncharacterized protein SmJEL517_g00977 [Synchytrium microbalum]TPX36944.1 hypothetical protein SmJEL517_g00977 [Synchytrium microbalum]